ncbi:hypothetical protein CERSUDRAFT_92435 [Gelatoporia subvermispora B]|uniref:Uncharacterized protein n=1 Tax=Ceriporiopsis subvermispora (strain B) TaxID=914234 RepID=M2QSE6_CERS8|nr:hypothetical protein CERSUDRAFT_92435 [Gelatoporia subvermispora B]
MRLYRIFPSTRGAVLAKSAPHRIQPQPRPSLADSITLLNTHIQPAIYRRRRRLERDDTQLPVKRAGSGIPCVAYLSALPSTVSSKYSHRVHAETRYGPDPLYPPPTGAPNVCARPPVYHAPGWGVASSPATQTRLHQQSKPLA